MADSHWQPVAQFCNILDMVSVQRLSKSIRKVASLKLSWKYCSLIGTDDRCRLRVDRAARFPKFSILLLPQILRACPQLLELSFKMTKASERVRCLAIPDSVWRDIRSVIAGHNRIIKKLSWRQYRTANQQALEGILQVCPKLEDLYIQCNRYFRLSVGALKLTPLSSLRVLRLSWNDGSHASSVSAEWSSKSIANLNRLLRKRTPVLETLKIERYGSSGSTFQRFDRFDAKYVPAMNTLLEFVSNLSYRNLVEFRMSDLDCDEDTRGALLKMPRRISVFLDDARL